MATSDLECPICQEDLKDPRLLPCIHSFCLECLQTYCQDAVRGDDMPCPVCKNVFEIPKDGVAGLSIRSHAQEPFNVSKSGSKRYCEIHDDERMKMYCFDCNMNVCAMCCHEGHKTHKFERIDTAVEQFSRSIDEDIEQISSSIKCFHGVAAQLEAENSKALDNIKAMFLEVQKKSKEIKQIVDRHENELHQKLQTIKLTIYKKVKSHRDTLQLALSEMESFRTSSLELRSKGSPSDITQAANDVHERAKELLQAYVIPSEYHAPSYEFTPANTDDLLKDNQNFIGHVVEIRDSGKETVSRSTLNRAAKDESPTQQQQQQQQGDAISTLRLSSDARVIKKMSTGRDLRGVTSVDDELFALLVYRRDNQVAVYSINDYKLLRHLSVPGIPGYKPDVDSDITSCVRYKCIYMSDCQNSCVHKYDLKGTSIAVIKRLVGSDIKKWSVLDSPRGLSVTLSCNLLVTCQGKRNKLVEMSADSGQRVREIELQSDIKYPHHSVQMTTGQYLVCHGGGSSDLHRVCVVGDDGKVTRSYGGQCGSDVGQLNYPCHLAVDKDSQFIFVADNNNNRVVLLSPTLEFVRYVTEGLSWPCRLYFHQATRRLFVGEAVHSGAITVVQL